MWPVVNSLETLERTLTRKQQELIELYANEVEGRSTNGGGVKDDSGDCKEKEGPKDQKGDKSQMEAGWFSHPWLKIKKLMGD